MKKQIDRLVALATEYVLLFKSVKAVKGHNEMNDFIAKLTGKTPKDLPFKLKVYFSDDDYKTWAVYFGDVEIMGYSGKIEYPYNFAETKLKTIADQVATALLVFSNNKLALIEHFNRIRKEKIEELAKEIKELKTKTF